MFSLGWNRNILLQKKAGLRYHRIFLADVADGLRRHTTSNGLLESRLKAKRPQGHQSHKSLYFSEAHRGRRIMAYTSLNITCLTAQSWESPTCCISFCSKCCNMSCGASGHHELRGVGAAVDAVSTCTCHVYLKIIFQYHNVAKQFMYRFEFEPLVT